MADLGRGVILFLNGLRTTADGVEKRIKEKAAEVRQGITEANKRASIVLYQFVLRNFQSQGGEVGGWEPLAESTVAQKRALGYSAILQNTGALRASFLPYSDDQMAVVGSPLWYARPHEEGTARIPQRRMLPNAEEAQRMVLPIYGREMKIVTGRPL